MGEYGPQGWWPLFDLRQTDASEPDLQKGYHPGNYDYPQSEKQRFEIAIGSILTQNTSWVQVEKALGNLYEKGWLTPEGMLNADENSLKQAVRPAGYYNQKAERLKIIARFFLERKERRLSSSSPERGELLALKGVGPETADSILLYAFHEPEFVVDAYTRRLAVSLGWLQGCESYQEVKELFVATLPRDVQLFQEYHALIVTHLKKCPAHPKVQTHPSSYKLLKEKGCLLASLYRELA